MPSRSTPSASLTAIGERDRGVLKTIAAASESTIVIWMPWTGPGQSQKIGETLVYRIPKKIALPRRKHA